MHAASVHPEPGSNSLINCILSSFEAKIFLTRAFCSALLLFVRVSFFSKRIFKSSVFVHFCLLNFFSSLFNFQGSFALHSRGVPCYYIKSFLLCQYLFWKFFNFFSKNFSYLFIICIFIIKAVFLLIYGLFYANI